MNSYRDLIVPLIVAGVLVAATAVYVAINFSGTAAVIFSLGAIGWLAFSVWFTRAPDEEEQKLLADTTSRYAKYAKQIPSSFDAPEHGPIVRARVPLESASERTAEKTEKPQPAASKPVESTGYRQTIVDGIVEIQKLVNKTSKSMAHHEAIMSRRLNKTSNTEHRSLLTARKIITALDERVGLLKKSVDNFDNGRDDRETALALLKAPLVIPHDPLTALPGEEPIPPIPPEAFESTLRVLLKTVARKPSFLHLLGIKKGQDF